LIERSEGERNKQRKENYQRNEKTAGEERSKKGKDRRRGTMNYLMNEIFSTTRKRIDGD
jgi:hypothetical protein